MHKTISIIILGAHTEQDQGSFGPRSSAIQLYLIQHWGGPFFWLLGEGYFSKWLVKWAIIISMLVIDSK